MSILYRMKRLESMQPKRLIVLARLPDGAEKEMTAPEFIKAAKNGADFIKAIRGNDLRDARLILSVIPSVID